MCTSFFLLSVILHKTKNFTAIDWLFLASEQSRISSFQFKYIYLNINQTDAMRTLMLSLMEILQRYLEEDSDHNHYG